MTLSALPDPNELAAYGHLMRLHAGDLSPPLPPRAVRTYAQALEVALDMPAGLARQSVLTALNSGVGAARRAHDSAVALEEARQVLKASRPEMEQALRTHATIGALLGTVRLKLRDAYAADQAAGRDPQASAFFLFAHDLYGTLDAVRAEAAKLLGVARPADPRAQPDDHDADGG